MAVKKPPALAGENLFGAEAAKTKPGRGLLEGRCVFAGKGGAPVLAPANM